MTPDAEPVPRQALGLPDKDRADVAAHFLASLDASGDEDQAAVQTAWTRELERRAQRALSGHDPGEDWASLRRKLVDDIAG